MCSLKASTPLDALAASSLMAATHRSSIFPPLSLTHTHKHAYTNRTSSCPVPCDLSPSLHFWSSECKVDTKVRYDLGCLVFVSPPPSLLSPVVGVKLDISAWMASFINTTYRMNVSRSYLYARRLALDSCRDFSRAPFSCFQCNDEICGCERNSAVRGLTFFFFSQSWTCNTSLIIYVCFQYIDCVILDDGGFLVMSNREEYITQVGIFFSFANEADKR